MHSCLFLEVVVGLGGAGDYVAKVDVKIKRVSRIFKVGLKWRLPTTIFKRPGSMCCIISD